MAAPSPTPSSTSPGPTRTRPRPSPEELAKEFNGKALGYDLFDPKDPTKLIRKAGEQLGFGQLRDDGSTANGCWIFGVPGRRPAT